MLKRLELARQVIDFANGMHVSPGDEYAVAGLSASLNLSSVSKVRRAVFPVAGLATEMLPATKSIPNEVMTLIDRPIIQYAIDEARASGIEEFVFVTSRGKSALEDYFSPAAALEHDLQRKGKTDLLKALKSTDLESGSVAYVQQNDLMGLGHAIWCARHSLRSDEPFAVILPNDVIKSTTPCLQQMLDAYRTVGGSVLATMEASRATSSLHSFLLTDKEFGSMVAVKALTEESTSDQEAPSLAVAGRYILSYTVMNSLSELARTGLSELNLLDALNADLRRGNPVHGFRFKGQRFDCGSKSGFLKAMVAFGLSREELRDEFAEYLDSIVSTGEYRKVAQ